MGNRAITKARVKNTWKYWLSGMKLDFNQLVNAVFSCGSGNKHLLIPDKMPKTNQRNSSFQGQPGDAGGLLSLLIREWVK